MFEALTELAGKPRAKEQYPTFRVPMLQALYKEQEPYMNSNKSSSSGYDSNNDDEFIKDS